MTGDRQIARLPAPALKPRARRVAVPRLAVEVEAVAALGSAVGNRALARVLTGGAPLARQPVTQAQTASGLPDPSQYEMFDDFRAAAPMPYTDEYLHSIWDSAHPAANSNDIVLMITEVEKPADVADYWASTVRPHRDEWAGPLSQFERNYISAFRDPSTPEVLRMRAPVDPDHLSSDERSEADGWFGTGPDSAQRYANYENRRRILANYVLKHPATVRLELGLYRLVRDVNPLHFALERGWQIGSGKEMFTDEDVSRLGAAGEFLLSLAFVYGVDKGLGTLRPTSQFGPPAGDQVPLTDPIWDLPLDGGGMRINGRWYTEHALERMAPKTPQVRAQITARVAARLARAGFKPGHPGYNQVLSEALSHVDPRGVPPAVVEAEIVRPGSTSVRVITARQGHIVVTVIPR